MANVGTTDIRDAAITTPKLARGAVTADKLAADARGASGGAQWGDIGGLMERQLDLNTALRDTVSISGSYDDPSWLASLDAGKLAGTIATSVLPSGLTGTYTFDASTTGAVTSMTFDKGILTGVTTL